MKIPLNVLLRGGHVFGYCLGVLAIVAAVVVAMLVLSLLMALVSHIVVPGLDYWVEVAVSMGVLSLWVLLMALIIGALGGSK